MVLATPCMSDVACEKGVVVGRLVVLHALYSSTMRRRFRGLRKLTAPIFTIATQGHEAED